MTETFYWHDYETFGTDPSRDRPVQFAGLRTDRDLNTVGEPLVIFAAPARDQSIVTLLPAGASGVCDRA